jgi:hypothetical protein
VAGRRAACAALVRAARSAVPTSGRITLAFVVEQGFTRRGLLTVARTLGPFDVAVLLEATSSAGSPPRLLSPDPRALPHFEVWGLRVRYPGTAVETVSLADARELERRLRLRLGGAE